jgi:hypothetical protein
MVLEIDKLQQWKKSVETEIQAITDTIQSLNGDLQRKNQQHALICKLIDSENGSFALDGDDANRSLVARQIVTPSQVTERVYEILSEAKQPMNIKTIHEEFIRRGYPIPGKGTHFNILVHIVRELKNKKGGRFKRDGRGTYSLRRARSKKQE